MKGKRINKGDKRVFVESTDVDWRLEHQHQQQQSLGLNEDDTGGSEEGRIGDLCEPKLKGVSHLIDVQNPNQTGEHRIPRRVQMELQEKEAEDLKVSIDLAKNMARLALFRRSRDEAVRILEEEKQTREAAKKAASERAQQRLTALRGKGKKGSKKKEAETKRKPPKLDSVTDLIPTNPSQQT